LEDCQLFLQKQFDLHISIPTISRQLRKASGGFRPNNKARRFKIQRDAEGRPLDLGLSSPPSEATPQTGSSEQEPQNEQQGHQFQNQEHEDARFEIMSGNQP
jgi:hypothetical protein